ncbi:hypothetical protein M408DRAFT_220890 [Serendipita vermifera MAFF 305830]|uniref:Ferritin-like domain-containing protein n=1 Tax=Serendipita vermifera MAFF 305830 TaxID=933852 RepID=A0A0C2X7E6_SERVB|nr:hypothetical protein M408DRAFT_220890 [Serendipita vermifera MAFF 305830]
MRFSVALIAAAAPFMAMAAPVKVTRAVSDTTIAVLKFAELLEQLETEFYKQALAKFTPQDFTTAGISVADVAIQNFQAILEHETAHVAVLGQALADNGDSPLNTCTFDFAPVLTDVATMAAVARTVEHVGVGAYLGGADLIAEKEFLGAAASILTIEARHQSFLNIVAGASTVPQAVDVALSPSDVLSIAGAFVKGCDPAAELGLPPGNAPLAITNTGTVAAGTKLAFSSPALNSTNESNSFCQMIIGGNPTALSLPINECIVPEGLDGPVWIWITSDNQPLNTNIHVRATDKIIAGPTAAFIDSRSNALGALVRNADWRACKPRANSCPSRCTPNLRHRCRCRSCFLCTISRARIPSCS